MAPAGPALSELTAPKPLAPGLYIVATPIGNLRDITLRALDVLAGADLVLCEDTRVGGKLLAAHGISAKLERYDEHAAARARPMILARLAAGARIALTSDAGTPLISDPGYRLVREAAAQGVPVMPIPGPSALLAGLTVSGLPTDRFLFAGFPPPKSAARRQVFEELRAIPAALIFYESGPRLAGSLADMADVFGDREAAVARELTKLHETVLRGALADLAADPRLDAPRGEIVVIVGPPPARAATWDESEAALREAVARLGPSGGAAEVARALGLPRRDLYSRALALKSEMP
jgi:16S rRNA (cytidine1402-2'-O)-methyltransferase